MTPTEESKNLLNFVSTATVDIHTALGKQSKKRTVNIKKYAQKRVKRLDQGKGRRGAASASQTKSKSALLSPPSVKKQQHVAAVSRPHHSLESSNSCPELNLPPAMPLVEPRTIAVPTSSFPTYSSHLQYSYSDSNLHPPTSDEIDYLAALLNLDDSSQQPISSRHTSCSVTPCLTPQPTLETQVGLAEHPYSPYSDCYSDDFYGDSAYSSHNCSPVAPPTCVADWSSMSPCSVAQSDYSWTSNPLTTSCQWGHQCAPLTVTAPMPTDQGLPATPTVEQVLSEFGSYQ